MNSLRPQLLRIASASLDRRMRAKVDASDVVQDAMLEAVRDRDKYRGASAEQFAAWLQKILCNNLHDARRRFLEAQARDVTREEALACENHGRQLPGRDRTPSSLARRREGDTRLQQAISDLAEIDQRIVRFRYEGQLTFVEIGNLVGLNPDAVRKRWRRTVLKLQESLQRDA